MEETLLKNQEIIRLAWNERKLNMAQKKGNTATLEQAFDFASK